MRTYLREGIPPKDFNMLLGHILGFLLIGEGHILNSYMTLGEREPDTDSVQKLELGQKWHAPNICATKKF